MTSNGTRLDVADDEIRVSRKVMHESKSVVSNFVKFSRPPDGMLEVDDFLLIFCKGG